MNIIRTAVISAIIAFSLSFAAVYFHDKNIVNQCNKYGYTDSMAYGGRLSCLETDEN